MLIFMASSGCAVVAVVVTVAVCPLATVFCSFIYYFYFNSGNYLTCIIAGSIDLRCDVACC